MFNVFGQRANTFYDFNRGCYPPIVFKWIKKLVSINPILPVSRSIKGGAGDIQTPSLSRTENKFSTRRQSWSKWLKVVATRTKTSRLKIVTSRTKNHILTLLQREQKKHLSLGPQHQTGPSIKGKTQQVGPASWHHNIFLLLLSTAISPWIHQFSSDHWS